MKSILSHIQVMLGATCTFNARLSLSLSENSKYKCKIHKT